MKLPKGSIMVSHLLVVEYMTPDGELCMDSESYGSDADDLDFGKLLELIEHARFDAVAPRLAQAVAAYCLAANDDDDEYEYEEE